MRQGATSQRHEKSPLTLLNPTFYINHLKTHKRQNQMVSLCIYHYISLTYHLKILSMSLLSYLPNFCAVYHCILLRPRWCDVWPSSLFCCCWRVAVEAGCSDGRSSHGRLGCAPGLWGSLPRAPKRKEQNHQQRSRNPGIAWENHGKHDGIIAYSSCNMRDKCGKTMIIFAIFHAWLQSGHGAEH